MKDLTVILKRPGEDPVVEQIENNPASLREAVIDSVTKQTFIANDGRNRFAFVTRKSDEGDLNFIIDGATFFGPAIFIKIDPTGKRISLTEEECEEWLGYIGKLNMRPAEDRPVFADRPKPGRIINDSHSIQIVPAGLTDDETGNVLTPEQVIERMAEQWGIEFEHVPVTDQNVYGSALVVIESSGVEYTVTDEATMLLCIGEKKIESYLRVIEITKIEGEGALEIFPHLGAHKD